MHRCKHIPQPLKADPQAKAVVRASTSPTREMRSIHEHHLNSNSTVSKNYFLKSPSLLKILKTPTHNPSEKHSDSWLQNSILTRVTRHGRQERQGITACCLNWR